MKNIRVASNAVLLLAIFSFAGCDMSLEPFESFQSKPSDKRFFRWTVVGDAPVHIEWSFQSHQGGAVVRTFTTDTIFGNMNWKELDWSNEGSPFRLHAISEQPKGHVWANLVVENDLCNSLLEQIQESDSGAVEIAGTVP
jgi:hypothetical protein